MTDQEYVVFEGPFRERAGPILRSLAVKLTEAGYGPMKMIDVDQDADRGMGFELENGPAELTAQLMLLDMDAEGLEGVALRLECSAWSSGVVWAPGNYTDDVCISSVDRLIERMDELEALLPDLCLHISQEWDRVNAFLADETPQAVLS